MPKVTQHVARNDGPKVCPSAKKGQTYYHWRTRMKGAKSGMDRCTVGRPPRQSELTHSPYLQAVYALQEDIADSSSGITDGDDLESARDGWAQQARDIGQEEQDKFENMPEGLQQGDTGQMLECRAQACESWGDEIESVDIPNRDDFDDGEDGDDEYLNAVQDALQEIAGLEPESC